MWNPFRKSEGVHSSINIPLSTMARWYIYDSNAENPNELAVSLGLNPISEDGEELERRDSSLRGDSLTHYLPFISIMSDINAQATTLLALKNMDLDPDMTGPAAENMRLHYHGVSYGAIYAAFSAGLSLGIIENPGLQSIHGGIHDE